MPETAPLRAWRTSRALSRCSTSGGETVAVKKGESYFLPAASGPYAVTGTCQTLVTTV